MVSNFQTEKQKKRQDSVAAKREQRRDPELRKRSGGLGVKRTKIPTSSGTQGQQMVAKNTAAQSPAPTEQPQTQSYFTVHCKDRLDISAEAMKRYKEETSNLDNLQ